MKTMIKTYKKSRIADEGRMIGWAVAAVACRERETQIQVRVRPFTVRMDKAATREEAEAYAYEQMTELWTPEVGWIITVSAMEIRGLP